MSDCLTHIEPISHLTDLAVTVLVEDNPRWPQESQAYKAEVIEDLKKRSLRRVTRPGYCIFSMIVNRRVLMIATPLRVKISPHYNPFKCCS